MFSARNKKRIKIRGHDHPLVYHGGKKRGSIYECNGCQQLGFGPYYSCNEETCNLYYHPCCSELLSSESSSSAPGDKHRPPPYPTGILVSKERAPRKVRSCIACGDKVQMLRYKWQHEKAHGSWNPYWRLYQHLNNRAFHPLCASLPPEIKETGKHKIVLRLMERIQGECLICNGNAKGWAYNSTGENYCCHVGCMKEKIIQSWGAASDNGGTKRKVTIYVKKALRLLLDTVRVAFQLIIGALFALYGLPSENLADIVSGLFEFTFDRLSLTSA